MKLRLVLAILGLAALAGAAGGSASVSDVRAATVRITTTLGYQDSAAVGTGIVIDSDGSVLTNNHVIKGATSIRATDVGNGRTYTATVLGYSVAADVAVLRLANASGLKTAEIGSSAKIGQPVTTYGNASGTGVTKSTGSGKVTAVGRSLTVVDDQGGTERLSALIQTDASLHPGDSGGPLVDTDGRVIGMDTAAMFGFEFRGTGPEGYAIPIGRALALVHQITDGHASATVHVGPTAMLGVRVGSPTAYGYGSYGALVAGVVPGSPADHVGLETGDVITSLGYRSVASPDDLSRVMTTRKPGTSVAIVWLDQMGNRSHSTVRLATGPPQ
jgi:S1-C subfamily serine protease